MEDIEQSTESMLDDDLEHEVWRRSGDQDVEAMNHRRRFTIGDEDVPHTPCAYHNMHSQYAPSGFDFYGLSDVADHYLPSPTCFSQQQNVRREAYAEGYRQAMEDARLLSRMGYDRGAEIRNILGRFADGGLAEWVAGDDEGNDPLGASSPPALVFPMSWKEVRQAVFERDGYVCQICDSGYRLEADHIQEVRAGGCPDLDNIRTLCARCHSERRRG